MNTNVLIVGAGPTGLMLANQLARRGVRARIIDRHAGPVVETRALGVQARTLEIYAQLGIAGRALELGRRATGASMWARGRKRARVPLGDIGRDLSPYPFLLILGQDDNERLLGDRLRDWGLSVEWNTELVGLVQETHCVRATVRERDGTPRELAAAWVAGCDGARSAVRELCRIEFQGAPYEHVFFVADVEATGAMVPDELNVYLWSAGFHLFFPMRGRDHWRIVGILPTEMRGREDLTFDEVIPALRQDAGEALAFKACKWFSTYRIHHRRAARFRDRRCFLLGDAAHVHSPVGAQGMNTGLQDAYNLAWKLALVVSGRAGTALLDSYESERVPVASRLLATTDRAFSVLVSDTRLAGLFRTRVMPKALAFAMRREKLQRLAFRTISQTGIRYPDSLLSQTIADLPADAPRAGDRFPWLRLQLAPDGPIEDLFQKLDDTRFNLIVIEAPTPSEHAGSESSSSIAASDAVRHDRASGSREIGKTNRIDVPRLGDLLRVHSIASSPANDGELARARIPRPSVYLLRPDGHIGLAGTRLDVDALDRYISQRLRVGIKDA